MSGEGFIAADPARAVHADRGRRRSRQSMAVTEAIVTERAGVLAHARAFCAALDRWQARCRFGEAEAKDIKRAVRNFANDIAIGLHVDGEDAGAVRETMRARIKDMEVADGVGND